MAVTGKGGSGDPRAKIASASPRGNDRRRIHLLIIFCLGISIFGYSTSFGFVWDDNLLLLGHDVYRDFDLRRILFSLANQVEYLPIRDLSYALDYALWGENPFGFRLTNLLLHCATAGFVYLTTLQLTALLFSGRRAVPARTTEGLAVLTALLFGVHPIQVEAVSFISCRNVLLSGLFAFMSCFFFLKYLAAPDGSRRKAYAASFACCLLAIFSKATAVALPFALLLLAMIDGQPWRRTLLRLAPFLALTLASVLLFATVSTQTGVINPDQVIVFGSRSFAVRLAVALQIPFFYLAKLAFPTALSALYDAEFAKDLGDPWVLSGMLAMIAAFALGIRLRHRFPILLFALGWYLIALLPVLNFFATSPVVADRYAYLSAYAFVYGIAAALILALPKVSVIAIRSIAAAVVIALSFLAFERSRVWRSDETLWQNTIRVSPNAWKAQYNLGTYYFERGEYEKAFGRFEELAERRQSDGALRIFRARYALQHGDATGAIDLLDREEYAEESPAMIPFLLGQAYERSGNTQRAIDNYANALRRGGRSREKTMLVARDRLESLRAQQSLKLEGQRQVVSENPSDLNARVELALACDRAGLYDEALLHYLELSRRGGDYWSLHYNLGNLYRKLEQYEKAVDSYETSASMNPDHPETYNNLGVALKKLHEYDRAIRAFEIAMRVDPSFKSPPFNLATLYFRLGDAENARQAFDQIERSFPELKGEVKPYRDALR